MVKLEHEILQELDFVLAWLLGLLAFLLAELKLLDVKPSEGQHMHPNPQELVGFDSVPRFFKACIRVCEEGPCKLALIEVQTLVDLGHEMVK